MYANCMYITASNIYIIDHHKYGKYFFLPFLQGHGAQKTMLTADTNKPYDAKKGEATKSISIATLLVSPGIDLQIYYSSPVTK